MKNILLILFVIVIALGCSDNSNDSTESKIKKATVNADMLIPLADGNKWVYESIPHNNSSISTEDTEYYIQDVGYYQWWGYNSLIDGQINIPTFALYLDNVIYGYYGHDNKKNIYFSRNTYEGVCETYQKYSNDLYYSENINTPFKYERTTSLQINGNTFNEVFVFKGDWGSNTYHYVVRGIGIIKIEQYDDFTTTLGYELILKETELQ